MVAQDTLGGAVGVAQDLPAALAATVLDVAQDAFVQGMQVAAAISGVLAVGVALFAVAVLRNVRTAGAESEPDDPEPARSSMDGALADPC
jgi:DHA2 family multidrug resistance protein-like MFS transporter